MFLPYLGYLYSTRWELGSPSRIAGDHDVRAPTRARSARSATIANISILVGFKAGAALSIAVPQLPGLLGVPGGGDGFFARLAAVAGQLGDVPVVAAAVGLTTIALLLAGEKLLPDGPVALLVVALAIVGP